MKVSLKKIFEKKTLLQVGGSIVLIALVLNLVDWQALAGSLASLNFGLFALSFLIFLLNKLIASYRWKLLLAVQDIHAGIWPLFRVTLLAVILNSFLPSTLGGDSARIVWLIQDNPSKKASSVVATLFDRFQGMVALVLLVLVILPFNDLLEPNLRLLLYISSSALLLAMAFLLWTRTTWLVRLVSRLMVTDWLKNRFDQLMSVLRVYKRSKRVLLYSFIFAILFQAVAVINQYIRFLSIGVDVSLPFLFLAIPVTTLVVTIPISVGGIGLREITLISLLGLIGIEKYQVVSYTVVGYISVLLLSILLFIYNLAAGWMSKRRAPAGISQSIESE